MRSVFYHISWLVIFCSLATLGTNCIDFAAAEDSSGSTTEQGDPFERLRSGVKRYELSNGLKVLIFRRSNAPVFTGQAWVKVGGVNEAPGITGIAHLFEHMAFKGTEKIGTIDSEKEKALLKQLEDLIKAERLAKTAAKKAPLIKRIAETEKELQTVSVDNEFSLIYQERGAQGLNAATSKDFTYYTVDLPVTAFELWCWMESERLFHPVFRQFYKEREVVQEERRMRFDDNPSGLVYETVIATAFRVHPNRLPVIGYPADLKSLTATELADFHRTYYRPDNMVLSLVGDIDPEHALPMIKRYFERIPKAEGSVPQVTAVEPPQKKERHAVVHFDSRPEFMMAYHKPVHPDPDDARFAVLHSILSEGRSSLLYRELVQTKRLATSVGTSEAPGQLFPNLFYVVAFPNKDVTSAQLAHEIQAIFDRLKTTTLPEEQIEAAKRRVRIGILSQLASNGGLAEELGSTELLQGDWQESFRLYQDILNTSAKDLQGLAKKYLNVSNRTFVELVPTKHAGKSKGK